MNSKIEGAEARPCWFVGASYGGTDDQTDRFMRESIWDQGEQDKYTDMVKSIRVGDRIAIKAAYTKKDNLPFDNRYRSSVSVMKIKAIGTVRENCGDGRTLKVEWKRVNYPQEWFFYTYRRTIWKVSLGHSWKADALIDYAFEGKQQDIDRFRNDPSYKDRFGDVNEGEPKFEWTRFYEQIADKLLEFKDRRGELVNGIHDISSRVQGLKGLQDKFSDGTSGPLKDICPFTAIGIFNRKNRDSNRWKIASELANFLDVSEPAPELFEGIPHLDNRNWWFFAFDNRRESNDIDSLWNLFEKAISFAEVESDEAREEFVSAFNDAVKVKQVGGWKLTMGLYWLRPWIFPTLDGPSRKYMKNKLDMEIGSNGLIGRCDANDYLIVRDNLSKKFQDDDFPVHSFPGLAIAARRDGNADSTAIDSDSEDSNTNVISEPKAIDPYSLDNVVSDGCFVDREKLEMIFERLKTKKNLILQGPPGTGKTWLARRLAYALIGERDDRKVRSVQFHPNLSYEDFIRGYRPMGEGKLSLVDGPFLEVINTARSDSQGKHAIVIEEINRGNPAQIFGEMLTLLEASKRKSEEALELCHRRSDGERVFIPKNMYVIGTMNIADRSLALVDLALRRRFAFISLEPTLGDPWKNWMQGNFSIDAEILKEIEQRINALNSRISGEPSLGPQFQVGHSYVTPPSGPMNKDAEEWFRQVVETEIGPLLDEYWFDNLAQSEAAKNDLLKGF